MKKSFMKKVISISLTLSMILTMVLPSTAFAEEAADELPVVAAEQQAEDEAQLAAETDVTLTMAEVTVTEADVRESGMTMVFTPQSGYKFDPASMSWADGSTAAGSNVVFKTTGVSTAQKKYVDAALEAAVASVTEDTLTVKVPKFDSAFTNFVGGASSGDITVEVSFAAGSVAVKDGEASIKPSLTLEGNTATIQEIKAIVYVTDKAGNKVDLTESDIRDGVERYITIEQQGNAGGGSRWSIKARDNGWTRRPKVAVNAFATDMTDPANEKDAGTEWEKIENYWTAEDASVTNPKDPSDTHRYYSLDWITCETADGGDADTLKFKVPQIEDFSIEGDLTIYGRLLRGLVGGTGGGSGNASVEPYWGTNGLMNFTIKDDVDDSKVKTITAFEPLAEDVAEQTVAFNTSTYSLKLPDAIVATVEGEEESVTLNRGGYANSTYWEQSPAYSQTTAGTYTFTYKYSKADYRLAKGVEAPKVTVTMLPGVLTKLDDYTTAYRVVKGTPLDELPLPETLSGKVGSTTVKNIPVTWTCKDGAYNADAEVGTVFTFTGAVDASKYDAKDVTVNDITVTLTEKKEISAFDELKIYEEKQLVPVDTAAEDLRYPDSITATVNGKKTELKPEWKCEPEYSADTEGKYIYTPVLPEGYVLSEGTTAPTLTVEVRKPDLSIGTAEEMTAFVNDNNNKMQDKLVVLTNDIDMYGQRVTGSLSFMGTFDGQGHRIYNINNNTGSVLFYELGERVYNKPNRDESVIRNTRFEGGSSKPGVSRAYVTAISTSVYGTIDRCAFEWDIYSSLGSSAITENLFGNIIDTYAIFNMETYGTDRGMWHGGFSGQGMNCQIKNSYIIQHTDTSSLGAANGNVDPVIGRLQDDSPYAPTSIENVYYLKDGIPNLDEKGMEAAKMGATAIASLSDFADPSLIGKLNAGRSNGVWAADTTGANGYAPVLKWEKNAGSTASEHGKLYPIIEKITADDAANGVVLDVDPAVQAEAGKTVTVRAYVDNLDLYVSGITVKTGSGENIDVNTVNDKGAVKEYTFVMPAHKVTISASLADSGCPHQIETVEDWKKFANAVNSGHDYSGEVVYVTSDLMLLTEEIEPVGTLEHPFNGTISSNRMNQFMAVTINMPNQDNVGLFGVIGPQGNVNNIEIYVANITGKNNVGAVAGLCEGVISNVKVTSLNGMALTVNGQDCIGGVAGYIDNKTGKDININNIQFDCSSANGIDINGTGRVGVMFGAVHGTDKNGITIDASDSNISKFLYNGSADSIGLYIGELKNATLKNANGHGTSGNISIKTSGKTAGGLVGTMQSGSVVYNGIADTTVADLNLVTAANNAGGIAGVMADGTTIENCFAYGNITAGSHAGGLTGEAQKGSTIRNCYAFTGNVTASEGAAGSVTGNTDAIVENTYKFATMNVTGKEKCISSATEVDIDRLLVKKDIYDDLDDGWKQENMCLPYFGKSSYWRIPVPNYMKVNIDDYQINTPEELYNLAISVATGNTYAGVTFTLGNDIDMKDISDMAPIGATNEYQGSFDGQGNKISNLNITYSGDNVALFGQVSGSSVIKNLTIENETVHAEKSSNAAALVASASAGVSFENIKLNNIKLEVSDSSSANVGSVVGKYSMNANGNSIKNCTTDGLKIIVPNVMGGYTGGIAGDVDGANAEITDCHVKNAEIGTGVMNVGGLLGELTYQNNNVKNCSVTDTKINGIWNGKKNGLNGYIVGGLIGFTNSVNIDSCKVEADITLDADHYEDAGYSGVGGIVGNANNITTVNGTSFTGNIKCGVEGIGGIIGSSNTMADPVMQNCYVNADISGRSKVGGIFGATMNRGASISNCYVIGSVHATDSYAGGIIGGNIGTAATAPATTVSNSYVLLSSLTAGTGKTSDTVGIFSALDNTAVADNGNYYFDKMYVNASDDAKDTFSAGDGTVTAEQALQAKTYTDASWDTPWTIEDGVLPYFTDKVETPAYFTGAEISAVAALAEDVADQTVLAGKSPVLPSNITATVGDKEVLVPVTWTSEPDFDNTAAGTYVFTPRLAENYTLAEGVTLPTITVKVVNKYNISFAVTPDTAVVTVTNAAGEVFTPDENGVYSLIEGQYTYTAKADGYKDATGTFDVTKDETITVSLSKESGGNGGGSGGSGGGGSTVTPGTDTKPGDNANNNNNNSNNSGLPFKDVKAGSWYNDAVKYVYENGMMNGTSSDMFSPASSTTRGMIVTILYRAENKPEAKAAGFTDVAPGAYYADAVAWAAANGIVKGYSESKFGPEDAITREQLAQILYSYASYKGYSTAADGSAVKAFSDYSKISGWAVTAMTWANASGLVNGVDANTLKPQGTATRAEVATMLQRFNEKFAAAAAN